MRRLLKELHLEEGIVTKIMIDNKSAQSLAKNLVFHDRSKHIDTKYHFIQKSIANRVVELEYMKSMDQVANIFTKPFKYDSFQRPRFIL